jgi:hypothetical protein
VLLIFHIVDGALHSVEVHLAHSVLGLDVSEYSESDYCNNCEGADHNEAAEVAI